MKTTLTLQNKANNLEHEIPKSQWDQMPRFRRNRYRVLRENKNVSQEAFGAKRVTKKENPLEEVEVSKNQDDAIAKSIDMKVDEALDYAKENKLSGIDLEIFLEGEHRKTPLSLRQNVKDKDDNII